MLAEVVKITLKFYGKGLVFSDVLPSVDTTKVSKNHVTHAFIPSVMSQEVVIQEDPDWLRDNTQCHLVTIAKAI